MAYKKAKCKSKDYQCTIKLDDKQDIGALETLKKGVALKRKVLKARGEKKLPVVSIMYRKPQLPYSDKSTRMHAWGGTVRKRQLPLEADIYIHQRYL
jgi:hypothetical protein